jgi:hypothetical protein
MSKVDYKSEVLEWIEDYKAGLVKPPSPFDLELSTTYFQVIRPDSGFPLVSLIYEANEDALSWHISHTILRVSEWLYITKKML